MGWWGRPALFPTKLREALEKCRLGGGQHEARVWSLAILHIFFLFFFVRDRVNVNTTDATTGATPTALLLPAQNTHTLHDPI